MSTVAVLATVLDLADVELETRTHVGSLLPWKLVETSHGEKFLFDLDADPGEHHDVAVEKSRDLSRMREGLETWRAALGLPGIEDAVEHGAVPRLDPAARERLRGLGYVE